MANNDLVGAVVKAMALVRIVSSARNGMRLNELAEAAGLKTVTCFNLVRTLVAGGFLEKINGRLYTGSEISRIAETRFQTEFFRQAESVLLKLNSLWPRATVIFAVPGKSGMEQTHRISFEHPGVIQRLNNEQLPPYASGAGLLGLAYIEDEDILLSMEEKYPFSELAVPLWKSRKALNAYLAKCRKDRLAVVPFDTDIFHRVSVPIFDRSGRFIAVIGISCPLRNFPGQDFSEVTESLKAAAASFGGAAG